MRSGQHNDLDFYHFAKGNVDVLYLHHWLLHHNLPELSSFCEEGNIRPYGIEVTSSSSSAVVNPVTPQQDTNKKREDNTSSNERSRKRERNGDTTGSATAVAAITMKSNEAIISMLFSNRMKYLDQILGAHYLNLHSPHHP